MSFYLLENLAKWFQVSLTQNCALFKLSEFVSLISITIDLFVVLRITEARRAARPERRKPSRTPNPLTCLAQRTDLRSEYEEFRSSSANLRTPTSNRPLMRAIDPACRLSFGKSHSLPSISVICMTNSRGRNVAQI